MSSAFRRDQGGEIETPADGGWLRADRAECDRRRNPWPDEGIEEAGFGGLRLRSFAHAVLQAFADDGPVAKIFGGAPDKAQLAAADFAERLRIRASRKSDRGVGAGLIGQDHEEAVAAGGAEQNGGQLQFGEQRAGDGFAKQHQPDGAGFEGFVVAVGGRGEEEVAGAEEAALKKNLR